MRSSSQTKPSKTDGFTLVEVLVIAPMVLLVIGGFIALMVGMVGDVLSTRDQNTMTYEVQNALDRIEQDIRLSTDFLATTGSLPSPQGSNNNFKGTAAFANNSSLILTGLATDKNPVASDRKLIYYANQPNACGDLEGYNKIFTTKIIYFINGGSLWRRTVVPPYNTTTPVSATTVCAAPWQQNSCSPGYGTGICQAKDVELIKNFDSLGIKYFPAPDSTDELGTSGAPNATTVEVTLTTKSKTAGRDVGASETLRATKLNSINTQ